jgi:hypothetical protein
MIFQCQNKDYKEPKRNIAEMTKGIDVDKKNDSISAPVEKIMPEEFNTTSEPTINEPRSKESEIA